MFRPCVDAILCIWTRTERPRKESIKLEQEVRIQESGIYLTERPLLSYQNPCVTFTQAKRPEAEVVEQVTENPQVRLEQDGLLAETRRRILMGFYFSATKFAHTIAHTD